MNLIPQFIEYCNLTPDKEACALIINKRGVAAFYPCKNISTSPESEFILDPIDRITAEKDGDILYVLHSHVNVDEQASEFDLVSCNKGRVPWIIYSLLTKKHSILTPSATLPQLVGRQYYYGVQDCWSIVKDIYIRELNITLMYPSYANEDWWNAGEDYFNTLMDEMGFIEVTDGSIKKYDVILMQTAGAKAINHSAVYYGDNLIIHHAYNRLSCRDTYFDSYWNKATVKTARHKDLI